MAVSRVQDVASEAGLVDVSCERCGAPRGRYQLDDDGGLPAFYQVPARLPPDPRQAPRRRGPRTGRRRMVIEPHPEDPLVTYLRWPRCGCGHEVKRRLDRIGDEPVTFSPERGAFTLVL